MSKKEKWSISILVIGFLLLLIFAIGNIDGIRAYLTDADEAENVSIIGGNSIEIIEDFTPPAEINPGTSFTKDVTVLNLFMTVKMAITIIRRRLQRANLRQAYLRPSRLATVFRKQRSKILIFWYMRKATRLRDLLLMLMRGSTIIETSR